MTHVYRFRPATSLLGTFKELERQQIFFAGRESLNDPMEGSIRMFWQGDEVLWRNLFQHYAHSLLYACMEYVIAGEEYATGWDRIPIRSPRGAAPTPAMSACLDELIGIIFSYGVVNDLVSRIGKRQTSVRSNELRSYLIGFHSLAVVEIFALLRRHKCLPPADSDDETVRAGALKGIAHTIDILSLAESVTSAGEVPMDARESLFAAQLNASRQLDLIHRYQGVLNVSGPNKAFALVDFPHEYPARLAQLVYPEFYTACFSRHCSNSSMWGHYAGSHQGVCLIFNAEPLANGLALKLRRLAGSNGAGDFQGDVHHPFHPVQYQEDCPEVDFFALLGMLPVPVVNRDWYYDHNGRRTARESVITNPSETQSQAHWGNFERIMSTKTSDWAYEEELRLTFHSTIFDLRPDTNRVATYDFSALHGIAFGMRTSVEDKLKIMSIIDQKCSAANRTDFKFYQAYFPAGSTKIELAALSLLKFSAKKS